MLVIPQTTRADWKQTLHEQYNVDEDTTRTLLQLIDSDPKIAGARPETREELVNVVDDIEEALDTIDLAQLDQVDDHTAVKEELLDTLKADLGLLEDPHRLLTEIETSDGEARARAAIALGEQAAARTEDVVEATPLISEVDIATQANAVEKANGEREQWRKAARALGELLAAAADVYDGDSVKESLRTRAEETEGEDRQIALRALGEFEVVQADETDSGIETGQPVAAFGRIEDPDDTPPEHHQQAIEEYEAAIRAGEMELEELEEIVHRVRQRLQQSGSE